MLELENLKDIRQNCRQSQVAKLAGNFYYTIDGKILIKNGPYGQEIFKVKRHQSNAPKKTVVEEKNCRQKMERLSDYFYLILSCAN